MRNSYLILISVIFFFGCKKENSIIGVNYSFNFGSTVALDEVNIISKIGFNLKFELKTIYIYENYTLGDYRQGLHYFDSIEFDNAMDWTFSLDSFNTSLQNELTDDYSAALIIDKTANDLNGSNYADGFNYFISESIEDGNEFMLVGSSRIDASTPMKIYSDGLFNTYETEQKDALYNLLSQSQSGTPSLYDAIDETMNALSTGAVNTQKHIIVVWDRDDDGFGKTANEIAVKADSLNIQISFIRFDWSDAFVMECTEIAQISNGLMMVPNSTSSFYSCSFSLNKLLSRNYLNLNFYMNFNSSWVQGTDNWPSSIRINQRYDVPFVLNY